MSYRNFTYEIQEHVAHITINRPEAYNALTYESMQELLDITNRCSTDTSVRAVVLRGSGEKAFCAGGDVGSFATNADRVDTLLREMTGVLHTAISRLAWMNAPVIAAVNGVAAGAGLSLVAAADLAISVDHAKYASAYTQIGLSPDGSSTYFLPRVIGRRRAMEIYLTNRTLTATEALDWGLVNHVVSAIDFNKEVTALAENLANGPTIAFGGVKKLLMMSSLDSLESQMERETRQISELSLTLDGKEGVLAFTEKRKPKFVGK